MAFKYLIIVLKNKRSQPMEQQKDSHQERKKYLKKVRKVADCIHSFIRFPNNIWAFIDTPEFQRLRKIKQVGLVDYVFPTATHTRFQHSLGCGFLSRSFVEKLIKNHPELYTNTKDQEDALLTLSLAGLMHDLGHGPFSHLFDNAIVQTISVFDSETKTTKEVEWKHERASVILFEQLARRINQKEYLNYKENLVTEEQIERIKRLIEGKPKKGGDYRIWEYEIVSNSINGIDVDKFDYFRRDAFYLGAKDIYIDYELLMEQAKIIGDEGEKHICYPTKYDQKLIQIFHARYKLYKVYYLNSVVKGIQYMIIDILHVLENENAYNFKSICENISEKPEDYLRLTDHIIDKAWEYPHGKYLLNRLENREIYKFVAEKHTHNRGNADGSQENDEEMVFSEKKVKTYLSENLKGEEDPAILNQIRVSICQSGFGLKNRNPLSLIFFFRKEKAELKIETNFCSNSMRFLEPHSEKYIKIYITENDSKLFEHVRQRFSNYGKEMKEGEFGTPYSEKDEKQLSKGKVRDDPI